MRSYMNGYRQFYSIQFISCYITLSAERKNAIEMRRREKKEKKERAKENVKPKLMNKPMH